MTTRDPVDPWVNEFGEPLDPSHSAADWCALWFHMCIYNAYSAGQRHPWHWWFTAAREFESLDRRRASDYRSELWGPQSTWPPIPEEAPCPDAS